MHFEGMWSHFEGIYLEMPNHIFIFIYIGACLSPRQETQFDMLEYFAGRGNLTRCMRLAGFKTASYDLNYKGSRKPRVYKSNPMDITTAAGFWPHG